jgi:MATE family multidrug resistance protein
MACAGALYLLFPMQLLGLFRSDGASGSDFLAAGAVMLGIAPLWQVFDAMNMTFGEALRAAGDTIWSMRARIVIAWGVFAPVSWYVIVVRGAGVMPMMACLAGYMVLLAVTFALRFGTGSWRQIQLLESAPI